MLNKGGISMNIGLALIPSKSFQDEVNGYRKRYDTEYARIMPHITIKSHFEINDDELDSVKEEVKKIRRFWTCRCSCYKSFKL